MAYRLNCVKRLLALETSGKAGSVALACMDDSQHCQILQTLYLKPEFGSAKTLASIIHRVLEQHGQAPRDLSAIAVTGGPGSFTGLRVGIATAKALAYALNIPVVDVDTLDVVIVGFLDQAACSDANSLEPPLQKDKRYRICSVLDAYRGQLFCRLYDISWDVSSQSWSWTGISETHLRDVATIAQDQPIDDFGTPSQWLFIGPGCDRLAKEIALANTPSGRGSLIRMIRVEPDAQHVARIGGILLNQGKSTDPFLLLPRYYRGSAAEENKKLRPAHPE